MAEPPRVRRFEEDDLDRVLDVLRAALGEPPGLERTPDLFRWKHLDNPFGRSLMLVAEVDERVAGFRAFMRWELVTPDGSVLRCGRAVDTATHPDFQRRGVFRALTEEGLEQAAADGIDLIFNTPNAKSGAGYLKMGWHEVGPIGVMVRPGWSILSRPGRTWGPESAGSLPDWEAAASVLVRDPVGLRTRRTSAYLRWRFGSHPTARYVAAAVPDGIAIGRLNVRSGRRELVVSEVGGRRGADAVRSLIRARRPDYAVAWFSPGSPERRMAINAGLIPVPRVAALTLVARPIHGLAVDTSDPARWDLALGDLELL